MAAFARGLQIPINVELRDTPDRMVCLDNLDKPVPLAGLSVRIIGPPAAHCRRYRRNGRNGWPNRKRPRHYPRPRQKRRARDLDNSVPNLSSIMLLVEAEGKTVLLTGDGRGDHLLEGLQQAGLLETDGTFHVDVFKLPHHGSARNLSAELFERIIAGTYVICADGKHDNPDFQTLEWLVQAGLKQGRSFRIVATNETAPPPRLCLKSMTLRNLPRRLKVYRAGSAFDHHRSK